MQDDSVFIELKNGSFDLSISITEDGFYKKTRVWRDGYQRAESVHKLQERDELSAILKSLAIDQ